MRELSIGDGRQDGSDEADADTAVERDVGDLCPVGGTVVKHRDHGAEYGEGLQDALPEDVVEVRIPMPDPPMIASPTEAKAKDDTGCGDEEEDDGPQDGQRNCVAEV